MEPWFASTTHSIKLMSCSKLRKLTACQTFYDRFMAWIWKSRVQKKHLLRRRGVRLITVEVQQITNDCITDIIPSRHPSSYNEYPFNLDDILITWRGVSGWFYVSYTIVCYLLNCDSDQSYSPASWWTGWMSFILRPLASLIKHLEFIRRLSACFEKTQMIQ